MKDVLLMIELKANTNITSFDAVQQMLALVSYVEST